MVVAVVPVTGEDAGAELGLLLIPDGDAEVVEDDLVEAEVVLVWNSLGFAVEGSYDVAGLVVVCKAGAAEAGSVATTPTKVKVDAVMPMQEHALE